MNDLNETKIASLYRKYVSMMQKTLKDDLMDESEFSAFVKGTLERMHCIETDKNGETSFLYYGRWEDEGVEHFIVLPYSCYANDEKSMVRLFQKMANEVVGEGSCEFSINLYADDTECIRAFHMMQFGTMSEKCIKKLENKFNSDERFDIRILSKEDIEKNWEEIWAATENIVSHLQTSPIFYPGEEFTEEVYRDYFMSDELEMIAAYDNGRLAGIIEWNEDENEFMADNGTSVNVGEAYVYQEYRGTGLAEKLLRFAEKRALEAGYKYMWVEHGTANPNARGFWNKYFNTYSYELVRSIRK